MHAIPDKPAELEKGKLIYSCKGFTGYFNWMSAAVYKMLTDTDAKNGKYGLMVDLSVQDHPRLKVVYT